MHMRTANYLPSGLAEKGHDSELPASYHRGKAMIDIGQAEKKLKGSEQNVTESTPQVVDSFYLIDSHNSAGFSATSCVSRESAIIM